MKRSGVRRQERCGGPRRSSTRALATVAAFENILPRLVAAYEVGRLVPFIGSGMSVPACAGWERFARCLEVEAYGDAARASWRGVSPEEIIRRANRAVRSLKSGRLSDFEASLRRALFGGRSAIEVPLQTRTLARVWWPLVLSTNYDDCYYAAFKGQHSPRRLRVVGRSPADCQLVLQSLTTSEASILWTLQGFLGGPCDETSLTESRALVQQLVVGHDEYRRVTYREQHFRRAFAEVFRSRSLLFLGSGLKEGYLQELLGEVLEIYGPSARPHYALVRRGEVDADFMLARFQIAVVEYDDHSSVSRMLGQFADAVERADHKPVRWTFGAPGGGARHQRPADVPLLDVFRGPLPLSRDAGECLAVSAGGPRDAFTFSRSIREDVFPAWGVDAGQPPKRFGHYIGFFPHQHVFAVRARSDDDEQGLEHIYAASLKLFDVAASKGYSRIHMQLLAAGGSERKTFGGQPSDERVYRSRTFPERYSFTETVRAYGAWSRRTRSTLRLSMHVVAPPVYRELASGRLDVLELLTCPDMRFWAEVHSNGEIHERRLFQTTPATTLGQILDAMNLRAGGWHLELLPVSTLLLDEPTHDVESNVDTSIEDLGVVPGSTLRLLRDDPPDV
ncbi:MAG: SIR2 family protein [Vicinamibacterales bacterium]